MKLQLDTTTKTIRLDEQVNLDELFRILKKLLPNDEWKGFKLEVNTQIVWSNPIIINPYIPINPYPWYNPIYVTTNGTIYDNTNPLPVDVQYYNGYQLSEGVFNIDIQ
jgi:hypothetical protein